ncbi:uncharacterized protein PV07_12532 [Cladophialophora immunda]|uniref:Uncharacterized protein n=1 Tax=Cladophialophora immunda TaxID=569365 RepID=A0A0D2CEV8_9EURO|nr:uncharacterized protein PV07_12532 [Cladophialophora immunda]KIW22069.1 hypothetical protein PV07_12532 [Cladophialophora immunda]
MSTIEAQRVHRDELVFAMFTHAIEGCRPGDNKWMLVKDIISMGNSMGLGPAVMTFDVMLRNNGLEISDQCRLEVRDESLLQTETKDDLPTGYPSGEVLLKIYCLLAHFKPDFAKAAERTGRSAEGVREQYESIIGRLGNDIDEGALESYDDNRERNPMA